MKILLKNEFLGGELCFVLSPNFLLLLFSFLLHPEKLEVGIPHASEVNTVALL